jgi:hypothetical protein
MLNAVCPLSSAIQTCPYRSTLKCLIQFQRLGRRSPRWCLHIGRIRVNGFGSALPLSGSFTYNSSTPDVLPGDPMWGLYANPIQNMTVKVGNYTATFSPGSSVMQVINNPGLGDTFKVTLNGFTSSPATVNGLTPTTFEMELVNPNGNVFANDHLPTTPPSLSSFASNQWRLVFSGVGNRVQGALTSLVPLPAAVWLFGAGLIALVGLGLTRPGFTKRFVG